MPQRWGLGDKIPRLHVVSGARGAYDPAPMLRTPLTVLAILVGIVLLVVCVNLCNLSMALTTSREREIAVRRAIGATPRRVIRQILTEHLVVAILGGAASLMIAYLFQDVMRLYFDAGFDATVVAFAFAVAVATGLLIGIAPALRAARAPAAVPTWGGPLRRSRVTSSLLVAQVMMSLVLLVGAGLFMRTLLNLRSVDPGFDAERLVLFTIDPAFNQYDPARTTTLYEELTRKLRALPGVSSVSFSSHALLDGSVNRTMLAAEGALNRGHAADSLVVAPDFFATMRIPVRSGRVFDGRDSASGPKVVIVNEAFARAAFGDANPVGRRVSTDVDETGGDAAKAKADTEVIGVVANTRHSSLRAAPAQIFFPHAQSSNGPRTFEVRTSASPEDFMPAIRKVVEAADAALPILSLSTQVSTIENLRRQERIIAVASSTLGALTLVVSMVGLFGLLSYAVTRRTRDIAVRMALGAQRARCAPVGSRRGIDPGGCRHGDRARRGNRHDPLSGVAAVRPAAERSTGARRRGRHDARRRGGRGIPAGAPRRERRPDGGAAAGVVSAFRRTRSARIRARACGPCRPAARSRRALRRRCARCADRPASSWPRASSVSAPAG